MSLKKKIINKSFYLKDNDETFNNSTIFLTTLFEIPEIKELLSLGVSKPGDYIINYKNGEGKELKTVTIARGFNEAIDVFNGDYGLEMISIRRV